jgi:hypothetical protein
MKVVLVRGCEGELTWEHETRRGAWARATSLAELHGAQINDSDPFVLTIDASEYYAPRKNRGANQ